MSEKKNNILIKLLAPLIWKCIACRRRYCNGVPNDRRPDECKLAMDNAHRHVPCADGGSAGYITTKSSIHSTQLSSS